MDVTVDEVALDGVSLLGGKLGSVLLYSKRQGRLLVDVLVVLILRESLPEYVALTAKPPAPIVGREVFANVRPRFAYLTLTVSVTVLAFAFS